METKANLIAHAALSCTFVALVLLFIGCNPTEAKQEHITTDHPTACIESYPVVPDTIVKGLEKWPLKVGNGPRNRCSISTAWGPDSEGIDCTSKSGDTTWIVMDYCPATKQALSQLGGN
ncbi:MAG: hypothetical protein M3P98_04195 [bacterium]|nr:hypothetical protein [bacterium]